MGKTKIKSIDDSQPEVEEKKVKKTKNEPIKEQSTLGEDSQPSKTSEIDKNVIASEAKQSMQEMDRHVADASRDDDTKAKPVSKKTEDQSKKQRSKKYIQSNELVDKNQKYPLPQAIELVQKTSYSKFPGTLEIHINTHQGNLRGLVTLPHSTGKKLTILAFGKGAKEAGADIVGDDSTIEEIGKGKITFDVIVATPEWMPKLAKTAKVLGPRGLMPNPKNGTITENLEKTIAELLGGKTEYKTESKGKVIHLGVGKISQPVEELQANIQTLYTTIGKSRISKITLASTMSPGVKVELSSI